MSTLPTRKQQASWWQESHFLLSVKQNELKLPSNYCFCWKQHCVQYLNKMKSICGTTSINLHHWEGVHYSAARWNEQTTKTKVQNTSSLNYFRQHLSFFLLLICVIITLASKHNKKCFILVHVLLISKRTISSEPA